MPETKNVFISHVGEDDAAVLAMKDLLKDRGFPIRDSSITSETPNQATNEAYIKSDILGPAVDWAGTVVVLISPGMRESEWVTWEIEYAQQHDKRIVGVWTQGASEEDVPEALELYADAVVGWNAERIHGAICGDINNWEGSDGVDRPKQALPRHNCQVRLHSYIVLRDYGFAPNPFHGFCTLATCKPIIRRSACIGDWVLGTGSKQRGYAGRAVFAMQVRETIAFDQYWADERFRLKRPNLAGSTKQAYGDNIYRSVDGVWLQVNSHHSLHSGDPNPKNINADTGTNRVLVAERFAYWGQDAPALPAHLRDFDGFDVCCATQGHKSRFPDEVVAAFEEWFIGTGASGFIGKPERW